VEFPTYVEGYAWQWSGGAVNRTHATGIKVTAGHTATANADLKPEGVINGKAIAAGWEQVDTEVVAVDTESGDYAGFHGWPEFETGVYSLTGLNDQKVNVIFRNQSWTREMLNVTYPRTLTTHDGKTMNNINFSVR
jgi:hypothetical protein